MIIAIRGRTLFLQPRIDENVSTSEVGRVPSEAGGTSGDASSTLVKRIASTIEAAITPTTVVKNGETKKGHKRSKTLHSAADVASLGGAHLSTQTLRIPPSPPPPTPPPRTTSATIAATGDATMVASPSKLMPQRRASSVAAQLIKKQSLATIEEEPSIENASQQPQQSQKKDLPRLGEELRASHSSTLTVDVEVNAAAEALVEMRNPPAEAPIQMRSPSSPASDSTTIAYVQDGVEDVDEDANAAGGRLEIAGFSDDDEDFIDVVGSQSTNDADEEDCIPPSLKALRKTVRQQFGFNCK